MQSSRRIRDDDNGDKKDSHALVYKMYTVYKRERENDSD